MRSLLPPDLSKAFVYNSVSLLYLHRAIRVYYSSIRIRIPLSLLTLLIVLSGADSTLNAQVVFRPNDPSNIHQLNDLFNTSVTNYLPQAGNVTLRITISDRNAAIVAEGMSRPFTMNPGSFQLTGDIQNLVSFTFTSTNPISRSLRLSQIFEAGSYTVCYQVMNQADGNALGDYCFDFIVQENNKTLQSGNTKKMVSFNGTSELLFNYSNTQSAYTTLPPTYLNWTLNPRLSVYDIPLSARLFLTTQQSGEQQSMNSFTVQFDVNQFREILKRRLLDYISKNKALNKVGGIDFTPYIQELSSIKDILGNENVMKEINQLRELDSLQQLVTAGQNISGEIKNSYTGLQNGYRQVTNGVNTLTGDSTIRSDSLTIPGSPLQAGDSLSQKYSGKVNSINDSLSHIKDSLLHIKDRVMHKADSLQSQVSGYISNPGQLGTLAIDSLKGRIKQLEWLESKRAYYDKLMERKNKIEDYARKFGLMDSSGNLNMPDRYADVDVSKLSDPNVLFTKLKSAKLLRKIDKLFYAVKTLSIGMGAPAFSSLSINGMAVNGITVEVEPFNIYGGFTYGEIKNPVYTGNIQYADYRRNIIAGKFGYGKKEKSHIHITILSATDDSTSIHPRDSLYLYYKLPQDNKVINVDGQLQLLKNKLTLSAEFSGSQTVKDLSVYATNTILNTTTLSDPSDWFVNILSQRHDVNKAVVDYAVSAKVEGMLFKDRTTVSASFKRIGPNYYSFGLPFLVRDMMTFEVKVTQKLWKNRISLSGFIRRNNDNLNNQKPLTTQYYTYGFDFTLRIPKWPSLRINMTPLMLQNDSSIFNLVAVNANSTYSFRIHKLLNIASLTFLKQYGMSDDSLYRFDFTNVNLVYNVNFRQGPNIQLNSGYLGTAGYMGRKDTWIIGTSGTMTFFKVWSNTIGGNIYVNQQETKWGAFYQTSVNMLKYLSFSLRLENNQFNTYALLPGVNDYTQFNCRTALTAKW